jgi:hypothetical protein
MEAITSGNIPAYVRFNENFGASDVLLILSM